MWMAIQNILVTSNRVSKWNADSSLLHELCQHEHRNTQHLFFQCSYANEVWETIHANIKLSIQKRTFSYECRKANIKAHGKSRSSRFYGVYVMHFTEKFMLLESKEQQSV